MEMAKNSLPLNGKGPKIRHRV
ncbi:hypothetical protein AYI69_g10466, partial [Smittium culicis]